MNSRIRAVLQLYLTYALMIGISQSAFFPVAISTLVRWFSRHRGMALGILISAAAPGTAIILPIIERSIFNYGWTASQTGSGLPISSC